MLYAARKYDSSDYESEKQQVFRENCSFVTSTVSVSVVQSSFRARATQMAQDAFFEVTGKFHASSAQLSQMQRQIMDNVIKAIENALREPSFANLSADAQGSAAYLLTLQCLQVQKLTQSLQRAANNPQTLSMQLQRNASADGGENVFDIIMQANTPSNIINC